MSQCPSFLQPLFGDRPAFPGHTVARGMHAGPYGHPSLASHAKGADTPSRREPGLVHRDRGSAARAGTRAPHYVRDRSAAASTVSIRV